MVNKVFQVILIFALACSCANHDRLEGVWSICHNGIYNEFHIVSKDTLVNYSNSANEIGMPVIHSTKLFKISTNKFYLSKSVVDSLKEYEFQFLNEDRFVLNSIDTFSRIDAIPFNGYTADGHAGFIKSFELRGNDCR